LLTQERKVRSLRVENIRLRTAFEEISGIPVIRAAGEIDIYTVPDFKVAINEAIDGGAKRLIVDLTDVSYMDSGGFGTLLGATKRLRPQGGSICLVGCSQAVWRMLKITRLDTIFAVYPTLNDAVDRFPDLQ
jgi:anti-sigma B factor antagonist